MTVGGLGGRFAEVSQAEHALSRLDIDTREVMHGLV